MRESFSQTPAARRVLNPRIAAPFIRSRYR